MISLNIFSSAGKNQSSAGNKAAYEKGLRLMMGWGVEPDVVTINARIHGAIQEGRLDEAVDTLERALRGVSHSIDTVRWSIILLSGLSVICPP